MAVGAAGVLQTPAEGVPGELVKFNEARGDVGVAGGFEKPGQFRVVDVDDAELCGFPGNESGFGEAVDRGGVIGGASACGEVGGDSAQHDLVVGQRSPDVGAAASESNAVGVHSLRAGRGRVDGDGVGAECSDGASRLRIGCSTSATVVGWNWATSRAVSPVSVARSAAWFWRRSRTESCWLATSASICSS